MLNNHTHIMLTIFFTLSIFIRCDSAVAANSSVDSTGCPMDIAIQNVDDFVQNKLNELSREQIKFINGMTEASKLATKPNVPIGQQLSPKDLNKFLENRHLAIENSMQALIFSNFQRDSHVISELLKLTKLLNNFELGKDDFSTDDPRQFYLRIIEMLRTNFKIVKQTPYLNLGIDCDPEAGLYFEEKFNISQVEKYPTRRDEINNLIFDIERIRKLYQLQWKIFNHRLDDLKGIRWSGDEPYLSDTIDKMFVDQSGEEKRLYSIVISYIEKNYKSDKSLESIFNIRNAQKYQ